LASIGSLVVAVCPNENSLTPFPSAVSWSTLNPDGSSTFTKTNVKSLTEIPYYRWDTPYKLYFNVTEDDSYIEFILQVVFQANPNDLWVSFFDIHPQRSDGRFYNEIVDTKMWFGGGKDLRFVNTFPVGQYFMTFIDVANSCLVMNMELVLRPRSIIPDKALFNCPNFPNDPDIIYTVTPKTKQNIQKDFILEFVYTHSIVLHFAGAGVISASTSYFSEVGYVKMILSRNDGKDIPNSDFQTSVISSSQSGNTQGFTAKTSLSGLSVLSGAYTIDIYNNGNNPCPSISYNFTAEVKGPREPKLISYTPKGFDSVYHEAPNPFTVQMTFDRAIKIPAFDNFQETVIQNKLIYFQIHGKCDDYHDQILPVSVILSNDLKKINATWNEDIGVGGFYNLIVDLTHFKGPKGLSFTTFKNSPVYYDSGFIPSEGDCGIDYIDY